MRDGLISTGFHIPYNPKLKERARELRKNMTVSERKIWKDLLRKLPFPVLRQKPLDNYIADFYSPALKLVIEIDGSVHSSSDGKEYDEVRTKVFEGYGLRVIRFTNDEVMKNFEQVCEKINTIIKSHINEKI